MGFAPVKGRVETLDVLRGLAIFGMFAVNMTADVFWADSFDELSPGSADYLVLAVVKLFAGGKFITIFSFLFAIGFYVQIERRMQAGLSVPAFWLKRMSGLLLIALVANALTIPAWILVDYSLFGLPLLLFYKMRPGRILAAAVALLLVERFFDFVVPVFLSPDGIGLPSLSPVADAIHDLVSQVRHNGTFLDVSGTAILHLWEELTWWPYYLIDLDFFVVMLLGLYVARRGAVWDEGVRQALAKKTVTWLLGIGIVSALAWVVIARLDPGEDSAELFRALRRFIAWPFATSVLGLGYVAAVALLMNNERWRRRLSVLIPVGRMVLTNFLFTGFVLAFVSYEWGLGLYGEVYPLAGLLIVAACLPLQVLASRWWLARFAFGPVEWLWRRWTYGGPLPLQSARAPA